MNHLKWMGHASTIIDIQKNLRNELHSCEVTLVAKGHSVRAHRFVLSSCSDLLRSILQDVPMGQESTIMVPDMKGTLLDSVLAFIYMGETSLTSSNLSEFLEAINILGIKSAISFECNTTALAGAATTLPIKALGELQIAQDELMEHENLSEQKLDDVISEQHSSNRDLEFLEVYNESQHKITYSIEHMAHASTENEFILTDNSGTFTLTQNSKLESASSSDSTKMEEVEEDTDDAHIIEEYSSGGDPIIEIAENNPIATSPIIKIQPKIKGLKLKAQQISSEHLEESMDTFNNQMKMNTSEDKYSTFQGADGGALDLAVQAVIVEGMSLQKAAHKYDLSKTVLWRRVRKHPNYMKTTRENPVLSLAYERLKGGEPLKSISRELDIPMSTLHRHKVRLAAKGLLPNYVSIKKRDNMTKNEFKEKLAKAVHACVHEGMSQNHAANLFDIPKSTLWRHLQKRVAEAELEQSLEGDEIKEEVILS